MRRNNTVLVIGKLPPPVGGVTMHVRRLMQYLNNQKDINVKFLDLSSFDLMSIKLFFSMNVVHLHASNSYLRLLIAFVGFLLRKKVVITYHGNLGRFTFIKNCCDILSVYFATCPIVINKSSLVKALKVNKATLLISAFIPPFENEGLSSFLNERISKFNRGFKRVFCTNAYKISYDKEGKEIYGGTNLLKLFENLPNYGLIFSDPSGEYTKKNEKNPLKNVLFIKESHSFYEVLKQVDGMIRATTTDGDALSIREALSLNKIVIASDCVDRPLGCITYQTDNYEELELILNQNTYPKFSIIKEIDNVQKILDIYAKLLSN